MLKSPYHYEMALAAFEAMAPLRAQRERLVRYTFGDQWADMVLDPDGNLVTEGETMTLGKRRPLSVNLIRRAVSMLVARFSAKNADKYDTDPTSVDARNCLPELDCRMLEEFIISGCAVQKVSAEVRPGGKGIWVDNIAVPSFFVNRFSDPRGSDITLIGKVDRLTWPQLLNRFGRNSRSRSADLKNIFDANAETDSWTGKIPRMQVIEMWTYEPVHGGINRTRYDMHWYVRHIAPDASVLADGPSAFRHKGHPFAVKFHPYVDGQTHSYVENLIERQRSINRMLTTFDSTMACSAKGVLLFPQDQLVRGQDFQTVAEMWARPDGVIPIAGRGSELPRQIITNAASTGIVPLIELQLKLFDEASGISSTLKGENLGPNIDAASRLKLIDNAEASVAEVLDTFSSFISRRNSLVASTI